MENNIVRLPENRCRFCGKEASLLCDKVKGVISGIDIEGPGVITYKLIACDNLICEKCATHVDGADYCPDCIDKFRQKLR